MLRARSFALPLDSHSSSCLSVYSSDFTGVKEQGITERYFGGGKCLSLERNLLERGESLRERRRFFWRGFFELRLLRRGVFGCQGWEQTGFVGEFERKTFRRLEEIMS